MLDAAYQLDDLSAVPGNRLHKLKGERKEYYGISVNDQWRVIFRWEGHDASDVSLTDYHGSTKEVISSTG